MLVTQTWVLEFKEEMYMFSFLWLHTVNKLLAKFTCECLKSTICPSSVFNFENYAGVYQKISSFFPNSGNNMREYFHSIHKFKTSRKYITNLGKYSHEKDFNSRVIWECYLYFIPNFENTMAIHIPIIIHSQLWELQCKVSPFYSQLWE